VLSQEEILWLNHPGSLSFASSKKKELHEEMDLFYPYIYQMYNHGPIRATATHGKHP